MQNKAIFILLTALIVNLVSATEAVAGPRDGGSLKFAAAARNIDRGAARSRLDQRSERVLPGEQRDADRRNRRDDRQERREDHGDERHERREDRREARWEYRWDHYWYHQDYYVHVYYAPGHMVTVLPENCTQIVVDGRRYTYCDGIYYRASGGGFVVVTAPHGAHVRVLPHGHYPIHAGHHSYHVYAGTYYLWEPTIQVYKVVEAPEGAVLPVLPEGAEQVMIRGERYYKVAGVYYQPMFDGVQVVYRSTAV